MINENPTVIVDATYPMLGTMTPEKWMETFMEKARVDGKIVSHELTTANFKDVELVDLRMSIVIETKHLDLEFENDELVHTNVAEYLGEIVNDPDWTIHETVLS